MLYLGEGKTFDRERVKTTLLTEQNFGEFEELPESGVCFRGRFFCGNESTMVELKADLESIVLSVAAEIGIQCAFQIQKQYPEKIYMVDSDYNFDLPISQFDNVEDFRDAVLEAMNEEER